MAHYERHRARDESCSAGGNDEKTCDTNNNSSAPPPPDVSEMEEAKSRSTRTTRPSSSQHKGLGLVGSCVGANSQEIAVTVQKKLSTPNLGQEHSRQQSARFSRTSESNASESDDWHLLDIDGQSISSASSFSSSQEIARSGSIECGKRQQQAREKRAMAQPSTRDSIATSDKLKRNNSSNNNRNKYNYNYYSEAASKYIETEPEGRQGLSPTLIYICTAIYSLLPLASLLTFVLLISLLFTKFWYVTIAYYTYVIFDAKTCNRGGRRWLFVYRAKFWSYLAAYFPIKLRYSNKFQLDPNENYVLNYHPHGISAFGCVASFATDGLQFSRLFPGLRSRFMVHETSFLVPIMRETFMFRGDCSVNSKSFDYILEKGWTRQSNDGQQAATDKDACGNLLALCGGGLAEADLSDMETLKVVCATRKGFVKKALIHGAHLIPCIAFSENSVFKKVNFKPGSLLHRLEKRWYELFKFKHPIYYGRSIVFGDAFKGSMPYQRPITVVMGDPIHVERVADPSQQEIDDLHSQYVERLKSTYEANKDSLCKKYDTKLKIV